MSNDSREHEEMDDDYNQKNLDMNENSDDERAYNEVIPDVKDEYESDEGLFDDTGKWRKQGDKEAEKTNPKKTFTNEELLANKKKQDKFKQ